MKANDVEVTEVFFSVVSPVYLGEKTVRLLVEGIEREVRKLGKTYEIILVEDASPDNSWNEIQKIAEINSAVKGIKLSRNFGQHKAIAAGLKAGCGQWFVVMDCDLQDPPEDIGLLFRKSQEGFDIVLGRRTVRQDTFLKRAFSKCFYALLSKLSGAKFDASVANFGIYSKKVIQAINKMDEPIRFFPAMVKWVGFKSTAISINHSERAEGKSSYSFRKLCNLGLDIVLAYSDLPLRIVAGVGLLLSFCSVILTLLVVERALTKGFSVVGYASLVCLILFCTG
ncbi:MAG TPA: glycosyltransferase family 2 protein, partial [Bdellovibrio sp.]|nr:glycosyltransferase family 2 protein [Bdellovibrio sp.]